MIAALIYKNQIQAILDGAGPWSIDRPASGDVPNLRVSSPVSIGNFSADGWSLIPVTPTDTQQPNTQQTGWDIEHATIDTDGTVHAVRTWAPVPAPVYTCALWQLRAALTPTQWSAVSGAIAGSGDNALIAYFEHGGNEIPSNSETLKALAAAPGLNLTEEQVAALIDQASQIKIS